ncbi:HNH endonuclease [Aeromonas caviae]|uniref:HNH endonuclease n=1 Tax=Aeromonas caviae TaxID=648 RepID=UPI0012474A69|nr:HNH endonuclease [Aeromonas caviae]KAB0678181.1 HNH endonuclease [Aeromonas caviae]
MEKELEDYLRCVLEVCTSRAAFVINHIIKHGSINSEHIRSVGFVHGARAVGDVRDNGVPLITRNIKSSDNRTIAEYVFGPASDIKKHKFGGRINFPNSLKGKLIERDGLFCSISKQSLPSDELQIDHRVPYYISGDIAGERNPNDFMLLSKSMQRAKSWDCEHCDNLKIHFDLNICKSCYWATPENYTHVAMRIQRSINLTWEGREVKDFDNLYKESVRIGCSPQELIKLIIYNRYNG